MSVKIVYKEVIEFLEANQSKKVSAILPELLEMVSGKTKSTVRRDESGKVTHVLCYYHKVWEDVNEVPYGAKASSSTGLNTMCKAGVSAWSKQQREAQKAKEQLVVDLMAGKVTSEELQAKLDEIEATRKLVV